MKTLSLLLILVQSPSLSLEEIQRTSKRFHDEVTWYVSVFDILNIQGH